MNRLCQDYGDSSDDDEPSNFHNRPLVVPAAAAAANSLGVRTTSSTDNSSTDGSPRIHRDLSVKTTTETATKWTMKSVEAPLRLSNINMKKKKKIKIRIQSSSCLSTLSYSQENQSLGFQRYVSHVEGNWSGHIYLPLSLLTEERYRTKTASASTFVTPSQIRLDSWEEQMNQISHERFLQLASQTIQHFVSTTFQSPTEAAAVTSNQTDCNDDISSSSNDTDGDDSDMILFPHFQYPYTDDDDTRSDDCDSNYNHRNTDYSTIAWCTDEINLRTTRITTKKRIHPKTTLSQSTYRTCDESHKIPKTIPPPSSSSSSSCCNLHVSLSKPFYLQQHNIQSFIADLTQQIYAWKNDDDPSSSTGGGLPLLVSFPTYNMNAAYHNYNDDDNNSNKEEDTHNILQTTILFNPNQQQAFLTVTPTEESSLQIIQFIRKVIDPIMIKYGFPTYRFDGKITNDLSEKEEEKKKIKQDSTNTTLCIDIGKVQIHVTIATLLGKRIKQMTSHIATVRETTSTTTTCQDQQDVLHNSTLLDSQMKQNERTCASSSTTSTTTISFIPQYIICVLGNYYKFSIPLSSQG